ncbi:hypothetical protein EXIGLDRAFT_732562 [Exidia glandulosa HHB12029]|uniref:Uncharacterized protein n=1 Tax=Exidia glandulosa HHB12029 TaxID=1314781 RepID=A0A165BH28_EXIGL|nr:hypothetical protein EXIGLDRAFT_732562 [Exidia glandulosa HHB12029]
MDHPYLALHAYTPSLRHPVPGSLLQSRRAGGVGGGARVPLQSSTAAFAVVQLAYFGPCLFYILLFGLDEPRLSSTCKSFHGFGTSSTFVRISSLRAPTIRRLRAQAGLRRAAFPSNINVDATSVITIGL